MIPVYNFHNADGDNIGCGTQLELDHWTAQGVLTGVTTGEIITYEAPSKDERRKAAWAREAA